MSILIRGLLVATAAIALISCKKPQGSIGPSKEVTTLGTVEVTAKLDEVRGEFPPNNLYDYVFVMKYKVLKVHRGRVEGDVIYVGHYNPLKPRASVADKFVKDVGGNVERFTVGDVHRMALSAPLDDCYMGGIIDRLNKEKGVRYWANWTEAAGE